VIREATQKVGAGYDLTGTEARAVMEELLSGGVPDPEIIAFLTALRDKGEKPAELVGFAAVMRHRAAELLAEAGARLNGLDAGEPLLDTCGTGGHGHRTFNVSTTVALVAAAAGVRVAKHGNRSISSRTGSADVLEALGVVIDLPLARIPQCLEQVGMVFLFAPHLHLAMRHVMSARRSLKSKTVFNLLGPLTNPLGATVQLLGVYDGAHTEMMALALTEIGIRRALVVSAESGIDEISTTGPTKVSHTDGQSVMTRHVEPKDFGLEQAPAEALAGGDPSTNAEILRRVLAGERGHRRDLVLANASAALVTAGKAAHFLEGVAMAGEVIDSGAPRQTLAALVEFTRKYRR
jgi:anthranilate phosphoribosyltransferase